MHGIKPPEHVIIRMNYLALKKKQYSRMRRKMANASRRINRHK